MCLVKQHVRRKHGTLPKHSLSGLQNETLLDSPESEMSRDLIHATHLNNVFGSWGCIDPSDLNAFVPYASSRPVVNTLQTSHDLIDVPSCSWEAGISTDTLPQLKVNNLHNSQPLMQTLASEPINAQGNFSSSDQIDSFFGTWEAGSNKDTPSQLRVNDLQNPQPWEAGIDTNALPQLSRQKTFQHSSMQFSASNLAETHDQITCTLHRLWPSVMLQCLN